MPDPSNPFTPEQFAQMEAALVSAQENEEAIKKAQRAGIELPGLLESNREMMDRFRKILNTYRPGR